MAKSQIIKDLANGVANIHVALKRTKVLLLELNNEELLQWVNCEIEGYPDDVPLPEYRKIRGELRGSYVEGTMSNYMQYTDIPLPLGTLPTDQKNMILITNITQGIEALKEMTKKNSETTNGGLAKPIPADFYGLIAHANNNMGMVISSARVVLNMPQVLTIFPKVESKLIDILSYLEKQFGNLDELDIDIETKSIEELENIKAQIYVMIYNDSSITLGDNNKMKDVKIISSDSNGTKSL
jgi:hypothetical protein